MAARDEPGIRRLGPRLSHPVGQTASRFPPAMHATLSEAFRHGFTGGGVAWEALLIAKLLKLACVATLLVLLRRELARFLG